MNYFLGTITHSTTGAKSVTTGFQAHKINIKVCAVSGGDTHAQVSEGKVDAVNNVQICDTWYQDATRGFQPDRYTDRVVSVIGWTGAAWVELVKITYTGVTATAIQYTVNTITAGYQLEIEAEA